MPLTNLKSTFGSRRGRKGAASQHPAITHVSMFSMSSFDAEHDLPIVYCDHYNMSLFGLELLHDFDTKKYRKLARLLDHQFLDTRYARHLLEEEQDRVDDLDQVMPRRLRYLEPNRAINYNELHNHHDGGYIIQVHNDKSLLARVTEIWMLKLLSMCCIEPRLIEPIKWQISGTIFAANLAMQHGWSINLGGGFHDASEASASNFCLFSDIMLAIRYIWRKHPLQRFLIIDLDAHQAVGLAHDIGRLAERQRDMIFLLDMFNNTIQPPDSEADAATNLRIELARFTGDTTYLKKLDEALNSAFSQFKASLVIYVAGQDVLQDDQLGLLNLSDAGLMRRDELVFRYAIERARVPIMMLLGGGYQLRGAKVQAESIRRLYSRNLIWGGHRSGSRTLTRPRPAPTQSPASSDTSDENNNQAVSASPATPSSSSGGQSLKHAIITTNMSHASSKAPQLLKTTAEPSRKSLDTIGTHPVAPTHPVPAPETSKGFTVLLKKTFTRTVKTRDGLDHPVDAISESISTSGGVHKVRKVVRVAPKTPQLYKLVPLESQRDLRKSRSQKRRAELTKKTVHEVIVSRTNTNKGPTENAGGGGGG